MHGLEAVLVRLEDVSSAWELLITICLIVVFKIWTLVVFIALTTIRRTISGRAAVRDTVDVSCEWATLELLVRLRRSIWQMNVHVSAWSDW